jgi:hypothetical protein
LNILKGLINAYEVGDNIAENLEISHEEIDNEVNNF